jgi:hypothetical protein
MVQEESLDANASAEANTTPEERAQVHAEIDTKYAKQKQFLIDCLLRAKAEEVYHTN